MFSAKEIIIKLILIIIFIDRDLAQHLLLHGVRDMKVYSDGNSSNVTDAVIWPFFAKFSLLFS